MDEATLLHDSLAPIASRIGFLNAPVDRVSNVLTKWRTELGRDVSVVALDGGLAKNVRRLEPLIGGASPRELVVQTANPEWTAWFGSSLHGGDASAVCSVLALDLGVHAVVVTSIPDVKPRPGRTERLGARQFELFAPLEVDIHNSVRAVSVTREGGNRWRFDAHGSVQDFENVAAYQRRSITERFTPQMLIDYAAEFGLYPFADDFYPGPSQLVTSLSSNLPRDLKAMTLEQARRYWGLEPG